MANVAYEQELEVVRALTTEEQQKLRQELEAEHRQQAQSTNNGVVVRHHREPEMCWLTEHEAEYTRQWLALDGDRLLSQGTDPHQIRAAARAQGVASPFVVFAENPDEFYSGAWL